MKRPPPLSELQRRCDDWNALHPLGTSVTVRRDNGKTIDTKTRSRAQILSNHSVVIWLAGITGCYDLARVTAVIAGAASG